MVQSRTETKLSMPITVIITDIEGETRTIVAKDGATLMEAARAADVAGIIAECGGACSCATCHVYIGEEWLQRVGLPNPVEEEMLDMVDDIRMPNSRLSCQVTLTQEFDGMTATVAPEL
jgi:2Fe-2S ferredoxin